MEQQRILSTGTTGSTGGGTYKEYRWFNSNTAFSDLRCGICRLDVPVGLDISAIPCQDLWVSAQIACHGIPIQEAIMSTSFAVSDEYLNAFVWNSLLNFHVKIKDLSLDTTIILTVWNPQEGGRIYGVTTMRLFDENGRMKVGKQKLLLYVQDIAQVVEDERDMDVVGPLSLLHVAENTDFDPGYMMNHCIGERYEQFAVLDSMFIHEKQLEEFHRRALFADTLNNTTSNNNNNLPEGSSSSSSYVASSSSREHSSRGTSIHNTTGSSSSANRGIPSHPNGTTASSSGGPMGSTKMSPGSSIQHRRTGSGPIGPPPPGHLPPSSWLDVMTLKRIQELYEDASFRGRNHMRTKRTSSSSSSSSSSRTDNRGLSGSGGGGDGCIDSSPHTPNDLVYLMSPEEMELQSLFCIVIELPLWPFPILHEERCYPAVLPHVPPHTVAPSLLGTLYQHAPPLLPFELHILNTSYQLSLLRSAHMVPMGCIVVKERDTSAAGSSSGPMGKNKGMDVYGYGAHTLTGSNVVASASRDDIIAAAVERGSGRWMSPHPHPPDPHGNPSHTHTYTPPPFGAYGATGGGGPLSSGTGNSIGTGLGPGPEINTRVAGSMPPTGTIVEFCISGPFGPNGTNTIVSSPSPGTTASGQQPPFNGSCLKVIADWDMEVENLAEQQYRTLAHDTLRATADPSAKPNVEEKERIDRIVNAAGTTLKYEEKDLLYRFRYFLTENKKALTKFLLSVDWTVDSEVAEVPILLSQWKAKAPIDISDALRLLGRERAFQAPVVRQYAVETLKSASDEDLLTFLLQLVQALRYEPAVTSDEDSSLIYTDVQLSASSDEADDEGMGVENSLTNASIHSFSSSFAWAGLTMSTSTLAIANLGTTTTTKNEGGTASSSHHKETGEKRQHTHKQRYADQGTIIGHHGAGLVSPLAQFLIDRACASPIVANFLYWYLKVETEDLDPYGSLFKQIFDSFLIQLASSTTSVAVADAGGGLDNHTHHQHHSQSGHHPDEERNSSYATKEGTGQTIVQGAECAVQLYALNEYINKIFQCHYEARTCNGRKDAKQLLLRKLLAERNLQDIPCHIESVPLPLNPRLQIVTLNPESATIFASAVYPCVIEFKCLPSATGTAVSSQAIAATFPSSSSSMSASSSVLLVSPPPVAETAPDDDEDRYRIVISGEEEDPSSVLGQENTAGDNTDTPVETKTHPSSHAITVKLMFKSGDDLRQDQLIMQMISLMDGLLRKVNLDLKVLTYGILAVGPNDGLMEFVTGAMAISGLFYLSRINILCLHILSILDPNAAILKEFKTISNFLRHHNPDKYGPYEISPVAIDTFVKSCAASCVISYILGIGDRHLDNIMVKSNGQLFHIDFGFIFGQDPKPVPPPPFRFTRHMADAMGGEDSEHYDRYKVYCCQAFNWLRKSANLILNLLSLMGDAGIMDISKRSDLPKVLAKVEEKFRLDLTDEQAEVYFIGLISESLNAIAPRLMEIAHQIAVARR